jgi:glycosyltransferase involved in cell wall biosynthesis
MRVAFLAQECSPGYAGGGIGTYTASLAEGLAGLGVDLTVVGRHDGPRTEARGPGGYAIVYAPRTHLPHRLRSRAPMLADRVEAVLEARRALRGLGTFDVVEGPDWLAEGLLTPGKALRARHVHGANRTLREWAGRTPSRSERLADAVESWDLRHADVVTVASRLSATLPDGTSVAPHARLVPMPVRLDGWLGGAAGDAPRVVTLVGRVEPRKGGDVLVRAAARLGDVTVRLVGADAPGADGRSFLDALRALATSVGVALDVTGPRPPADLPALLASSRVVAVPSRYEPFSMVALEALAASRPAVLSDACGAAEVLDVPTFPAGDDAALAEALRPLLEDPAHATALGDAGRARVETHHSVAAAARAKLDAWEAAPSR